MYIQKTHTISLYIRWTFNELRTDRAIFQSLQWKEYDRSEQERQKKGNILITHRILLQKDILARLPRLFQHSLGVP
jgi:hypothetical protein